MATKPVQTLAQMQSSLAANEAAAEQLGNKADLSPNFYSNTSSPSSKDVSLDIQLRDLKARQEKLQSNIIAQKMYGSKAFGEESTTQQPREGFIAKACVRVIQLTLRL